MELLRATMPKFDGYFKEMAEVEKHLDNWEEALKRRKNNATREVD
ncbi:MAG: hypothetical protein QXN34_04240 [Archaeoglobaceae archaeon]